MSKLEGACITSEQFLLREMRVACKLRLEGLDDDAIVVKIKEENLIQYPTERMLGRISRICVKRMNTVDSEAIVRIIAIGMPEASAQANLYAMMCTYPLVRYFMLDEIARRYASLDYQFGTMEINAFMTRLQAEYDNIADLTDSTTEKIKWVLRSSLIECGMLANARSEELIPIIMDFDVQNAITAKGDTQALAAFNCQEAL